MHETDPKKRFSNRVEDYVRFRPGYPDALLDYFRDDLGLDQSDTVADVGSGTGILTNMLLDAGNRVFAVEPNDEMRHAAEIDLARYDTFTSVAAPAEATTLDDDSVDMIVAAQAFHWFDRKRAKEEFARILRTGGWAVVLWNTRLVDATPFMHDYEQLLVDCAVDYTTVDHRHVDAAAFAEFFGAYTERRFPYEDTLDFDATLGRMLSASYVPAPGQSGYDEIIELLRDAFDRHQCNDVVRWVYETTVYSGRID